MGFEKISSWFGKPSQFRLTEGGANSAAWRQILADVFDTEVVRVKWDEDGAFGAALLALAVDQRQTGISKVIVDHIRKNSPLQDEVVKPFLVDKSNLDKAERIAEAK
jgi:xylulokinase